MSAPFSTSTGLNKLYDFFFDKQRKLTIQVLSNE